MRINVLICIMTRANDGIIIEVKRLANSRADIRLLLIIIQPHARPYVQGEAVYARWMKGKRRKGIVCMWLRDAAGR